MMKNKQETIEKIKQAALEEFYANGYAKASLRTICCRAGVTKDSESVLKNDGAVISYILPEPT